MNRKKTARVGANRRQKKLEQRKSRVSKVRKNAPRTVRAVLAVVVLATLATALVWGARIGMARLAVSGLMALKDVTVRGNERVATADILALVNLKKGSSLMSMSTEKIATVVQNNPWVEKVRVRRWLGGKVSISVTERTPEALVSCGKVYLMDNEGVLLDLQRASSLDMMLVSGLRDTVDSHGRHRLVPSEFERYRSLCAAARRSSSAWADYLGQIHFGNDETVQITIKGYPLSVIMSTRDAGKRMNQLWHLVETYAHGGEPGAQRINLCYQNLAYVE